MFLVVSRSDLQFGFEHPFFLRTRSGVQFLRNFARPKNRVPRKKFVHLCIKCHVNSGYRGELSCKSPKVPFCIDCGALLF